jgi:DNA-binding NtrC family response regulator
MLGQRGWDVTILKTAREARSYLGTCHPTVGVFDFACGFSTNDLSGFSSCFGARGVGWVGLLLSAQLQNDVPRTLVRRHFSRYIIVPHDLDRTVEMIGHEHGMVTLNDVPAPVVPRDEIVGTCTVMTELFRSISKVANSEAPVLIAGESGTGKELTAIAIHKRSVRRNGPFVAINCGALPYQLVQSDLFGYERGAFTGAYQRKIGRIEAAHGGTLFLDEVGDLPLESQTILLRFLQEKKIQRLGGTELIDVDVRIVAATNVQLENAVSDQAFRQDLYHRLCVLKIDEPPLREREGDIPVLAYHMLDKFRSDALHHIRGFSDEALQAMSDYTWPGNVRELINRVRRAIVMAEGRIIMPADLELDFMARESGSTLTQVREAAEREAIEAALRRHRGRALPAARELGISRATLYRLMGNHGGRKAQEEPVETPHELVPHPVPLPVPEDREHQEERRLAVVGGGWSSKS